MILQVCICLPASVCEIVSHVTNLCLKIIQAAFRNTAPSSR